MKRLVFILVLTLLASCANYNPVSDDYAGPIAYISDSGFHEDNTKAQMFVLEAIDGHLVHNSLIASRERSFGQGFMLTTVYVDRRVPIKPMRLKLVGTHATGAPIHGLFSLAKGTFFSVEGEVDFTPEPEGYYIIKGELSESGSAVWVVDSRNGEPVTEKVVSK